MSNRSTVYLRRNGYFTDPEKAERVVNQKRSINNILFGRIRYQGTTQVCIKADVPNEDIWYCVSSQFPLTREYELALEEEE